jgi:hypothetical protein
MLNTKEQVRSQKQNKAIHVYFTMVANALNEAGYTVNDFYDLLEDVGVDNTDITVKAAFRAIGEKQYAKVSTSQLTSEECTKVAEEMNRTLSAAGIHIPFPSADNKALVEYYQTVQI